MKRQRSFSNPAFMEQNKNALAYQLTSRDSMIPSVLRTKLKYCGNCFEDTNLSEEDETNIDIPSGVYLTNEVNSKNPNMFHRYREKVRRFRIPEVKILLPTMAFFLKEKVFLLSKDIAAVKV